MEEQTYGMVNMSTVLSDEILDNPEYPKDYDGFIYIPWSILKSKNCKIAAETTDEYIWYKWPESQVLVGSSNAYLLVPDEEGIVGSSEYMATKETYDERSSMY